MSNVTVLIDGRTLFGWTRVTITRAIDAIDTVTLEAPFDQDNLAHRNIFRPFSYKPFSIMVDDAPLITGTMVPVNPKITPEAVEVAIGAYSLPGVLSECTASAESLPLQFKDQNLHDIATELLKPFGLSIIADVSPGPPFDKVVINGEQKVLPFLADLAKQRNQVIGSTETGDLLFWRANDFGRVVAYLAQGEAPVIGITPTFDPSEYYSEVTGLKAVRPRSKRSTKFTVVNNLVPNIYRPFIFRVPNTKDVDLRDAVVAKASRMYANAIAYTIEVATWTDPDGNLWAPNTLVQLVAPGAMIYRPYNFIIRTVVFNKNPEGETTTLDVMVPGSFDVDAAVGGLPWDE